MTRDTCVNCEGSLNFADQRVIDALLYQERIPSAFIENRRAAMKIVLEQNSDIFIIGNYKGVTPQPHHIALDDAAIIAADKKEEEYDSTDDDDDDETDDDDSSSTSSSALNSGAH